MDSDGDMLSWLLFIVFLCWPLDIWVWGDYSFRCWFLDLCLLGGCFVTWFLLLLSFFSEFVGYVLLVYWFVKLMCSKVGWRTCWCWGWSLGRCELWFSGSICLHWGLGQSEGEGRKAGRWSVGSTERVDRLGERLQLELYCNIRDDPEYWRVERVKNVCE